MEMIEASLVDLMCAVSIRRLARADWNEHDARGISREIRSELAAVIPVILTEELPIVIAGLDACGALTPEKASVALTALAANRAIEIADVFIRRRQCQLN